MMSSVRIADLTVVEGLSAMPFYSASVRAVAIDVDG
jgi:hypothetical protein